VTPTSQIVGTQAMLNVKFGRWANLAQNTIEVALGRYGRTPGPVDPELLALAVKKSGHEPVTVRPANLLAPLLPAIREELARKGLPVTDDNAVLYAMFPRETEALHKPAAPVTPVAPVSPPVSVGTAPGRFQLTVNGHRHEVLVQEAAPSA
jgi:pyruvate carboxylase subunit B